MVDHSEFKHHWTKSQFACEVPVSEDYKVYVNGKEIPVYTCRTSRYPFNTWWPGHQRPVNQTEITSYVNLISDEEIKIEVEPWKKKEYKRIMLKPYSKAVKTERAGDRIAFTLKENGGYVLELDDYHGFLYIFNNKPVVCENPESVTYYFGPGVHMPGKIVLKSGDSVYLDKNALVYGCLLAENAENIHIYGNGIFDDSGEERFSEHCYEPYTNGNIKLYDCKNVKIEGVGFTNSAIWCVNLFHCINVNIDGINVFGQWRYNTDGIDIVNSKGVVIRNSFVHSFDDTITIKGIDRYAFENNTDILIEHCVLWCDWGKTCEIGLETACAEYRNIAFKDCDILRGGNTVCDIQNGDYAEVYDVTFEDIRAELEGFYTQSVLQRDQSQSYEAKDSSEIAAIVNIVNYRFREMYAFLGVEEKESEEQKNYAGVHNIKVKDIFVYADEKVLSEQGTKCIRVNIVNSVEKAEFTNISIENIVLNGKRVLPKEMDVQMIGCDENQVKIV